MPFIVVVVAPRPRRDVDEHGLAFLQPFTHPSGSGIKILQQLGIGDAQLLQKLDSAATWLREWLQERKPEVIYIPAWEGGHHDHDALHALATHLLRSGGVRTTCWQFSLYNAWRRRAPLFRVLSPLADNGPAQCETIPWGARLRYLRLCLGYPSQARSWLGLLPFVLVHYLLRGTQCLQPVDVARSLERPHAGTLYYEARGFHTWDAVRSRLREVLDR